MPPPQGEALNPEVYNRFYEYTGLKLYEGFGQTETTLTLANLAEPLQSRVPWENLLPFMILWL